MGWGLGGMDNANVQTAKFNETVLALTLYHLMPKVPKLPFSLPLSKAVVGWICDILELEGCGGESNLDTFFKI